MTSRKFYKRDNSIIGSWWWTIDKWTLGAILAIISIGMLLSFAASPPVAERLNLGTFFFVKRHLLMVLPSILLMFIVSLFSCQQVRRLSVVLYLGGLILMLLTLALGTEIKGARRWLNIASFSIQASEFVKPAFAVLVAWVLAEKYKNPDFPGLSLSLLLMGIVVCLLLLQPDLGMTLIVLSTWVGQLFIAGMPILWLVILATIGIVGLGGAYIFLPHVTKRIDQFLDPSSGDPRHDLYQVHKSLEAFREGGLFGKGPGEGIIKRNVPDAHADFVFAVAGEEFGLILCLALVGLFSFVIIRSFARALGESSVFIVIATGGVVMQFGLQTFVNMASALHLIPTKGMTMPFISYGGSSLLALGISIGMVLALTRRRHGIVEIL